MRRLAVLPFLLAALSVSADHGQECTISPSSGPTSGGTTVTIRCNDLKEGWPYGVIFGSTGAISTERTAADTLVAVAPPHLPGTVGITLFEYDRGMGTHLTYTFEGAIPESFERMLLPIFTPPVHGAFGSEFRTELRIRAKEPAGIALNGLRVTFSDDPLELGHVPNGWPPEMLVYEGDPGRFFFVDDEDATNIAASLRVYDVSRAGENFGTEIPIVRDRDFSTRILLLGIAGDARYRNTLRIYGTNASTATITIGGRAPVTVPLRAGVSLFDPAYAQFSDFPIGGDPVDVRIEAPSPVWAFVSVTNNETQLISTITPQP
jgi:hypothetical protein